MAPPAKLPLLACGMLTLTLASCIKTRPAVVSSDYINMAAPPALPVTEAERAADRADVARRTRRAESNLRDSHPGRVEGSINLDLASHREESAGHVLNTVDAHLLAIDSYDDSLRFRPLTTVRPVAVERVSAAKVVALLAESTAGPKLKQPAKEGVVDSTAAATLPVDQGLTPVAGSEVAIVETAKEAEPAAKPAPVVKAKATVAKRSTSAKATAARRKADQSVKTGVAVR